MAVQGSGKQIAIETVYLLYCLLYQWIYIILKRIYQLITRKERIPQTTKDILQNPKFLSRVFEKKVSRIVLTRDYNKDEALKQKTNTAEGVSSNHGKFTVYFEDNTHTAIFVKFPVSKFIERLFFLALDALKNETEYYKHMMASKNKDLQAMFPTIYFAYCDGCDFLLIMEDISLNGNILMTPFTPQIENNNNNNNNNDNSNNNDVEEKKVDNEVDEKKKYTKEKLKKVIKQYSRLHAIYWNDVPDFVYHFSAETGKPLGRTPKFLPQLFGILTFKKVEKKYAEYINDDVRECMNLFCNRFKEIRKYWAQIPCTMIHGDSHVGNIYFKKVNGQNINNDLNNNNNNNNNDDQNDHSNTLGDFDEYEAAFYDMQVVSKENGMRDITYHLILSYPEEELNQCEEEILHYYLDNLNQYIDYYHPNNKFEKMTYDQIYFYHRTFSAYWVCILSLCVAKGFVNDESAKSLLRRLSNDVVRLRTVDALRSVLKIH